MDTEQLGFTSTILCIHRYLPKKLLMEGDTIHAQIVWSCLAKDGKSEKKIARMNYFSPKNSTKSVFHDIFQFTPKKRKFP